MKSNNTKLRDAKANPHIILVEDDTDLLRMLSEFLQKMVLPCQPVVILKKC